MCNHTLQVQPLWRNFLKAIYNFIVNHMRFHSVLARLRLGKNKINFLVNSILSWFWKQRKDVKRAFGAVTWRKLSNKNCNISWISQWKCFKFGPMIDGIHIYHLVEKKSWSVKCVNFEDQILIVTWRKCSFVYLLSALSWFQLNICWFKESWVKNFQKIFKEFAKKVWCLNKKFSFLCTVIINWFRIDFLGVSN